MTCKFILTSFFSFGVAITGQIIGINAQTETDIIISPDAKFTNTIDINEDSINNVSSIYITSNVNYWTVTSNQPWLKISLEYLATNNGDDGDNNGDDSGDNGLDNGGDNGDNNGDDSLDNGSDSGDDSLDNGSDNGDDSGDDSLDNGSDDSGDSGDDSGDALQQPLTNLVYSISGSDSAVMNVSTTMNTSTNPRTALVIISVNNVLSDTIFVTQDADISMGINEITNTSVILYPIPVIDNLNVSFTEPLPPESFISIYNIDGEEVYSSNFTNSETTIDMSDLPEGTYIVKLYTPNKVLLTRKIIKQ